MIICAFENYPSIPSFLVTKIVYIGYGQLKKMILFLLPFHSCAPCIFISYCCFDSVRQCVIIICRCPQNIIEISLSRKMFIEICCQKCQKCNTICDNFFLFEYQGFVKKNFKYIHQNLRYYKTIEQNHFMVVKK